MLLAIQFGLQAGRPDPLTLRKLCKLEPLGENRDAMRKDAIERSLRKGLASDKASGQWDIPVLENRASICGDTQSMCSALQEDLLSRAQTGHEL